MMAVQKPDISTAAPLSDHILKHDSVEILRYFFSSAHPELYPAVDYGDSGTLFQALLRYYVEQNEYSNRYLFDHLQLADRSISENMKFPYYIVKPREEKRYNGAILLLHGLNEKSWRKYIPWSEQLCRMSGRPVILFPIAFHMDRAPAAWSETRKMIPVARERKKLFPDLQSCTFVNAALSHRIQFAPHRFLTSGMHSIFDAADLVASIREGSHPLFSCGATVDIFGYSIGATLAELLLFTDPRNLFSDSRAFLFCGGSVLNAARPVSRTIIDGEAHRELLTFFESLFSGVNSLGNHMRGICSRFLPEIEWFKTVLFQNRMKARREARLLETAHRISAAAMKQDQVFPPEIVRATLQGEDGSIPIDVAAYDLPFEYSHENPLPLDDSTGPAAGKLCGTIMDQAVSFFQYM